MERGFRYFRQSVLLATAAKADHLAHTHLRVFSIGLARGGIRRRSGARAPVVSRITASVGFSASTLVMNSRAMGHLGNPAPYFKTHLAGPWSGRFSHPRRRQDTSGSPTSENSESRNHCRAPNAVSAPDRPCSCWLRRAKQGGRIWLPRPISRLGTLVFWVSFELVQGEKSQTKSSVGRSHTENAIAWLEKAPRAAMSAIFRYCIMTSFPYISFRCDTFRVWLLSVAPFGDNEKQWVELF